MKIYYDAGRDLIFAEGTGTVWPARSLTATTDGISLSILLPDGVTRVLGPLAPAQVEQIDPDAAPFADVASAMAYLDAQFAMQRSLDIPAATGVAAGAIRRGMPIAVSRANGQLIAARADSVGACFVAGLASDDIAAGFVGNATRNPVTLSDWTPIAGTPSLAVGQAYFLAAAGGMTLAAPAPPDSICSVRLGQATSAQTFLFLPSYPIRL